MVSLFPMHRFFFTVFTILLVLGLWTVMKHLLSIAPMMDWSDRHYRSFMRLITMRTVLYTEMVTAAAPLILPMTWL